MTKKFAAVVIGISLLGGCYFGRSPTAKQGAYVANGAVALVGAAFLVSVAADDRDCDGDASCVGQGIGAAAMATVGLTLLGLATVGTIINLAVPTKEPAVAPAPPRAAIVAKPGAPLSSALELDLDRTLAE